MSDHIRAIAIYLPQFHPIPENDEWWGKGFTEWTNVAKAKPLFKNHYQPKLPGDLGFYDLRNIETRKQQAALAKEYGIEGFAYYHYWLNGRRLLERPFDEVLEFGEPDFPFCLIWANETWSRRWLGEEKEILLKQEYTKEDDYNHALYLSSAFRDKRYITKDGRPLFTIYRPNDIPNVEATVNIIKKIALKENGIEPYIVANNSIESETKIFLNKGFDAVFSFRPQLGALPDAFHDGFQKKRLIRNIKNYKIYSGTYKIHDYKLALSQMQDMESGTFNDTIPCAFVGFDNTARRGTNGIIINNNHPKIFEEELKRIKKKLKNSEYAPGFIFINAWNEWAEGNYLEPDAKNGRKYLEAVKNAFKY